MTSGRCVGNLTIYDNGCNGMSWERKYFDFLGQESCEYHGISGDEMLDYSFNELVPTCFFELTAEEQCFFKEEFFRIKTNAKRRDYYDAFDNTWKNYE